MWICVSKCPDADHPEGSLLLLKCDHFEVLPEIPGKPETVSNLAVWKHKSSVGKAPSDWLFQQHEWHLVIKARTRSALFKRIGEIKDSVKFNWCNASCPNPA